MKKICMFIITAVMFMVSMPVYFAAEVGVVGNYYYTDVKTYFGGAPVTAYNLGGKTAIVCEDLNWRNGYGHYVFWYADERKLTVDKVSSQFQATAGQTLKTKDGKPGAIAGNVYSTDIKTYLNGKLIESYNIGGQTVIVCEDMSEYGYDVEWDADKRELSVTGNNDILKMDSDVGTVTQRLEGGSIGGADGLMTYQLTVNGSPVDIDPPYCIQSIYSKWVPLAPTLAALGAEYEWDSESNKFTITSFEPDRIKTAEPIQSENIRPLGKLPYAIEFRLYYKDKEIPITMTVRANHMQNPDDSIFVCSPVVYDGVVYVPLTAIPYCLGSEVTLEDYENIIIAK